MRDHEAARSSFDRDGVINQDSAYVSRIEDFVFIEGIFNLCRTALSHGYLLIVVTNQAGIARGYYTKGLPATDRLDRAGVLNRSARRSRSVLLPLSPRNMGKALTSPSHSTASRIRGMLLRAAEKYAISLAESIMIGDKESDMEAAMRAGVESRIPVACGSPLDRPMTVATRSINSLAEAGLLLRGDDGRSG